MNAWAIAGLIVVVIVAWLGFWMAIMSAISRIGGWARLATAYPLPPDLAAPSVLTSPARHPLQIEEKPGQAAAQPRRSFSMQSITLRRFMGYNNVVQCQVLPQGLCLKLPVLFRAGHRAILLPWTEFEVEPLTCLGWPRARLRTRREPQVPILISRKLCDRLAAAAGASWPA